MTNLNNVDYPAYPSIEFSESDFTNSCGAYHAHKTISHPVKGIWESDMRHKKGDLVESEGWAYFIYNEVFQKFSISSCRKMADGKYDLCIAI
jgi:hypothetical protein